MGIMKSTPAATQDTAVGSGCNPMSDDERVEALVLARKRVQELEKPEDVVMYHAFEVPSYLESPNY